MVAVEVLKALLLSGKFDSAVDVAAQAVAVTDAFFERLEAPQYGETKESIISEFDDNVADSLSQQEITDSVLGNSFVEIDGVE
jgi:hypothetical protein